MLGAVAFGMNPYFGIPLYGEGMEPLSVLFYRFALGSVLMGCLLKLRGESLRLERRYLLLTALVGLLLAATCFLWFMSFRMMDSGIGATLIFIYPIMVALLMWGLYRERPSGGTMVGIVTALGGVALTCCPGSGARICAEGLIYLTLAALIYAIYFIIVRKSALRELSAGKLTFYAMYSPCRSFWWCCVVATTCKCCRACGQSGMQWGWPYSRLCSPSCSRPWRFVASAPLRPRYWVRWSH
jgi:drug/metabolite transporter (DMT)-like permease